jgi:hypothetical protein
METRLADFGFLGSVILSVYGFVYFIAYHLPYAIIGPTGASILMVFLGLLAGLGGILLSFGFLAFQRELGQSLGWLSMLVGLISWVLQGSAHLLLAAGNFFGAIMYSWAITALMVTFLLWGVTFFGTRKKIGHRQRFTLFAGLIFLLNGLGWLTYFGFVLLTLGAILSAVVFVSPHSILGLPSPTRLFNQKRQYQLGQLGTLLLSIYAILTLRWWVNQFFPLPVVAATVLNVLSVLCVWLAVLGTGIVFHSFETRFTNNVFGYAFIVSSFGLFVLSLADFTWLMSNVTVALDPAWGVWLYLSAPAFWGWSGLALCIGALFAGFGFLQVFRASEAKGDLWFLTLTVLFLISGILWLVGLGYIPLILVGVLILRVFMRQKPKTW